MRSGCGLPVCSQTTAKGKIHGWMTKTVLAGSQHWPVLAKDNAGWRDSTTEALQVMNALGCLSAAISLRTECNP